MKSALLVVDVQNDFLPGGALGVTNGDHVIPIINQMMPLFDCVVASRDAHPKQHISFASRWSKTVGSVIETNGHQQRLWPDHCINGEKGSELSPLLKASQIHQVFEKGVDSDLESYSVFLDQNHEPASTIDAFLKSKGITTLFIAGIATDYCVKQTVLDAIALNYDVFVVIDACKAVNMEPNDESQALEAMKAKGAHLIVSSELPNYLK